MHAMTQSYLEAVCFTETDDTGKPLDGRYEFSKEALVQAEQECQQFLTQYREAIDGDYAQAGHDFWLTRNHHGAGFWDGDWPKEAGQILTDAAHKAGERDAYIGDDGLIYFQ